MANIQQIVVIGGGTIGQGITELFASKGFDITLLEKNEELSKQSFHQIEMSLDKKLSKWGITPAEKKSTLSRIHMTTDTRVLTQADFVIESATEDLEVKKEIYRTCDRLCDPGVIIASTTSTLSLTEIAAVMKRPDRVIGLHFVHPVTTISLVEVVRGLKTSQQTLHIIMELLPQLELEGIEVYESPGFVTTRLMMLLINEALYTMMEGVSSAEDIDRAMKICYQFKVGPLEMADRFGLDSVLAAMERLFREFGDTKYRPAPLLKKMVRAGHLGVKTNEGFFHYNDDGDRISSELKEGHQ